METVQLTAKKDIISHFGKKKIRNKRLKKDLDLVKSADGGIDCSGGGGGTQFVYKLGKWLETRSASSSIN